MRTTDERIAAMHQRAAEIQREQYSQRVRVVQVAVSAVSLAAVVLLAVYMPHLTSLVDVNGGIDPSDMQASIFSDSSALGYIVVGIVAFVLGTAVTLFCFRLKKWQEGKIPEEF